MDGQLHYVNDQHLIWSRDESLGSVSKVVVMNYPHKVQDEFVLSKFPVGSRYIRRLKLNFDRFQVRILLIRLLFGGL
jgi:hypothetical protein